MCIPYSWNEKDGHTITLITTLNLEGEQKKSTLTFLSPECFKVWKLVVYYLKMRKFDNKLMINALKHSGLRYCLQT